MFYKIVKNNLVRKARSGTSHHAVTPEWKKSIESHWKSISRVAPHDQYVVRRKTSSSPTVYTELFYQQYPIREAWNLFKEKHSDFPYRLCSYRKFKPSNVKKPQSVQDACPICKESKRYQTLLTEAHPLSLTHDDIEAKSAYEFHKMVRNTRYSDYSRQMENLIHGLALLVIDFKANITLGKGPVEDSHVFFRAPQRTIFGGAAFFVSKEGVRYMVHFTIVSAILNHDSKTLLEMLRNNVFSHPVWKHFQVINTQIWMDNAGQHFRNFTTLATFHDLGKDLQMNFELNFFAEYHGKSECDRHFGFIGRMYKEATRYGSSKDITNTEEFISLYSDEIRRSGGHIVPQKGGFWDELMPESNHKSNVIVSEFSYETQTSFLEKLSESGTSSERKKPQMVLPCEKRDMFVSPIQKDGHVVAFGLNLYYKFNFTNNPKGDFMLEARLHDNAGKTVFPYTIEDIATPNYIVKFGTTTSWRPKYTCIAKVVRRRQFHEEKDYGSATVFLRSQGGKKTIN